MTTGSLDEGFEASQTVALNALEAVGKKAFSLLTTTVHLSFLLVSITHPHQSKTKAGTPEKPRLRPIYMSEQFDALRTGNSSDALSEPQPPVVKTIASCRMIAM